MYKILYRFPYLKLATIILFSKFQKVKWNSACSKKLDDYVVQRIDDCRFLVSLQDLNLPDLVVAKRRLRLPIQVSYKDRTRVFLKPLSSASPQVPWRPSSSSPGTQFQQPHSGTIIGKCQTTHLKFLLSYYRPPAYSMFLFRSFLSIFQISSLDRSESSTTQQEFEIHLSFLEKFSKFMIISIKKQSGHITVRRNTRR